MLRLPQLQFPNCMMDCQTRKHTRSLNAPQCVKRSQTGPSIIARTTKVTVIGSSYVNGHDALYTQKRKKLRCTCSFKVILNNNNTNVWILYPFLKRRSSLITFKTDIVVFYTHYDRIGCCVIACVPWVIE